VSTDQHANAGQLAAVLEQIADHSSDAAIRGHVRDVARALRGNGLIILHGPPQEELQAAEGKVTPWKYGGGAET
jgi:hypothetical protein